MGILVSCQSISKTYSSRPLFTGISLGIEDDQKVGLIGPNGSGKSTLLKIFADLVEPDDGTVVKRKELRVGLVEQQESFDSKQTIVQIVRTSAETMKFADHERDASIDSTLAKLKFPDIHAHAGTLSGGWSKRLALACALVKQPDLLLLDEPTNHLDLQGVLWLEKLLDSIGGAVVLVSHDRAFLEGVTNRIIELNPAYPQGFVSINGTYSQFLTAREEQLNAQKHLEQALASQVRREIAWLQRGARARQTKSRGRIKDAQILFGELADVKQRNALATSQIEVGFDATGRKRKELLVAKGVKKQFGNQPLFSNIDVLLTSGFKLGLVGRNGSGKTTLLRILLGELQADAGTVKRSEDLKIVWFDQNRKQLDQTKTLAESLSPTSDSVEYRGRNFHITTWAKKFLFKPDQLQLPISYLSGGEQSRILIANLMLLKADILVLDEPTNDLDIPSLEVLEESLCDFPGAIILVTHDRMMLDTVSDQILALDGKGGAHYFADYEQFENVSILHPGQFLEEPRTSRAPEKKTARNAPKTGMSTAEKRELAAMTEKIDEAEKGIEELQKEMEKPHVASNYARLQEIMKQQQDAKDKLDGLFRRWEELEAKSSD